MADSFENLPGNRPTSPPAAPSGPGTKTPMNPNPAPSAAARSAEAARSSAAPSAAKGADAASSDPDTPPVADPRKAFVFFQAIPAWGISLLVHVAILVLLGLCTIADPVKIINVLTAAPTGEEGPEVTEFAIDEAELSPEMQSEEMPETEVDVSESLEVSPTQVEVPMEVATSPLSVSDLVSDMAPASATLQTISAMSVKSMDSRSADMKKMLLRQYGGTESSEAAVSNALKWIAKHQMPNGAWTFMHTAVRRDSGANPGDTARARAFNAATAMAILPFLGSGQTHMQGEYKDVVRRGLLFLVSNGKAKVIAGAPTLDFSEEGGTLYSHGLAAIALCEAYAMSQDPALMGPAQAAINFSAYAQNADGGWRYAARGTPPSDTSVVGWHLMAHKSAYMANLAVPPVTIRGAVNFLDWVSSDEGSMYGYDQPSPTIRPACTAIGLLCRMYTGWDKNHPGLKKGVEHLAKIGVSKEDAYYNYYAAQVLRQFGGEAWENFNGQMRDWLVQEQIPADAGGAGGSWFYGGGHATDSGGRLYVTAMSTMTLEVYYRHMPIYSVEAGEDDFPL